MGERTAIEWTHHTFNPWTGCTKVSPACDHCYAEAWSKRSGLVEWGAGKPRRMTSASNWREPVKWNAAAGALGIRERVFCASLADVFDAEVPDEWRDKLFALIDATPHLDWQLLTKRPKVAHDYLSGRDVRPNVWLGTTVENQAMADARIPWLLRAPAKVRFLSVEPLLGPVDLWGARYQRRPGECVSAFAWGDGVTWVIVGGESGPHHRPMDPKWATAIRDECAAAGAAFFFKQWGGARPKSGGKMLDGVEHCYFPKAA